VTRIQINTTESSPAAPPSATPALREAHRTVYYEVDPKDRHNRAVFDLDKAPRNARGMVEFSADTVILRPVDPSKATGPSSSR